MTKPVEEPTDYAWARWGWLMGGVWLFFWIIPMVTVWSGDFPRSDRVLMTVLIAAFCVIYAVTLRRCTAATADCDFESASRTGFVGLVLLILTAIGLSLIIGASAMTAMPFIVGLPVFFLPWRGVWVVSLSIFGAAVLASLIAFGPWPSLMLWGISVMVLVISMVSRYMEELQERQRVEQSRLSLSEERERVARDVHDVLGHSLTVVAMKTELANRLIDADPARAKAELAEVQDLSRQALAEIRATVGGLRVARLADEVEAARMACVGAGVEAELPQDVTVVDPRHRITLAWVLREAVTNVVRHSRAHRCVVQLGSNRLSVTDDGRGLRGRNEGNGIRGVRERVEQAGGTMTLGPGPDGRGTRLEVVL